MDDRTIDKVSVFNQHGHYIETVFMDSSLALYMVNNRFSCTSKEILASNENKPQSYKMLQCDRFSKRRNSKILHANMTHIK